MNNGNLACGDHEKNKDSFDGAHEDVYVERTAQKVDRQEAADDGYESQRASMGSLGWSQPEKSLGKNNLAFSDTISAHESQEGPDQEPSNRQTL